MYVHVNMYLLHRFMFVKRKFIVKIAKETKYKFLTVIDCVNFYFNNSLKKLIKIAIKC